MKTNDVNYRDISLVSNDIRLNSIHNVIVGHLNVNSFSRNFDAIKSIFPSNVDIMIFSETKLDDTHPISEFLIEGFSAPFRLDENKNGGGFLVRRGRYH